MTKKSAAQLREDFFDFFKQFQTNINNYSGRQYIVGIDQSLSRTGVASSDYGSGEFISFSAPKECADTSLKLMARIELIEDFIEYTIKQYPPRLICMEGLSYGSKFNRELLGAVAYSIKRVFWRKAKCPVIIVTPSSLKKYVGSKEKKDILRKAKKELYDGAKYHDEADALFLALIGFDIVSVLNQIKNPNNTDGFWKTGPNYFKDKKRWEVIREIIADSDNGEKLLDYIRG